MFGFNALLRCLVCWLLLSCHDAFVASASYQESHVQVADDVFLHVLEYGELSSSSSDKVVLLVHGFPDLSITWQYQAERLAKEGYFVVTPDLRGFGSSSIPKQGIAAFGRHQIVSDMNALRKHYCGGDGSFAMIVGHDWGGCIVWATLDAFGNSKQGAPPPIAKSAIILNAPHSRVFFDFVSRPWQAIKSWYQVYFQIPRLPELLLSETKALYHLIKWHYDIDSMRSIEKNIPSMDMDQNLQVYEQVLTDHDRIHAMLSLYRAAFAGLWRDVEDSWMLDLIEPAAQWIHGITNASDDSCDNDIRITIPTLVLWGENDIALSNDLAKPPPYEMDGFAGVKFFDAGHMLHWDKPAEIAEQMIQFANEHNGVKGTVGN